jgi:hypothetical protein
MADALRQLLAEFIVSIDPQGELAKGHAKIDALKAASAALEEKLRGLGKAGSGAAATLDQAFAKVAAKARQNLEAINAAQLGGRANADPFAALGALRQGPQFGPGRAEFDAQIAGGVQFGPTRRELDAYAGSLQGKLALGYQAAQRAAEQFNGSGRRILDTFMSLRAGVAALGAGALVNFSAQLVNTVGGIGEAAAKLGVTTDEMQRLDVLAKQNATSVEAMGTAFRALAKSATDPTKDSAAAFAKLGVDTKTNGELKSRQDLFFETAGALADVSNETERAALAQQLFGRSGLELLPLLSQGRAGLEAQRAALAQMAVVSPAAIKAADEFGDRWEIVKTELLAKVAPLLTDIVIPAFEKFVDIIVTLTEKGTKFVREVSGTRLLLVGLGAAAWAYAPAAAAAAAATGGWATMLGGLAVSAGRAGMAVARVALPLLLLEDVFAFFDGAENTGVGRVMKWLFGEDEGRKIQQAANDILSAIKEIFGLIRGDGAGPALQRLGSDITQAAEFAGKDLLGPKAPGELSFTDRQNAAAASLSFGALGPGMAMLPPSMMRQDNRRQSVTVNVGSAAEVQGAVAGAQRAMGRDAAADAAAVGAP